MGQRVLIVDDSAFMRKMLGDIFTEAGYEIAGEAADGKDTVERYLAVKPDLVTMDIVMPEVNGIEAVKQLMREDPKAKVIIVSAMGQQSLVKEAIQAGAQGFVVKPFKPEKVIDEARRVLGAK